MPSQVSDACDETVCHGGSLGLEQIERLGGVCGVGAHQRRSGDQCGQQTEGEPTDPEEGRVAEQRVVSGQSADHVEVLLVSEQRGVGVYHALGRAGRTRRVDDRQRIGSVDVGFQCRQHRLVGLFVGFGIDQHMAQQRSGAADFSQPASEVVAAVRRGGQQDRHVAVDELFPKLGRHGERGERHDHGPDPGRGKHPDHEVGPVRVQQPDVSALTRAESDQAAGELSRTAVGIGVAEAVAVAHQERMRAP